MRSLQASVLALVLSDSPCSVRLASQLPTAPSRVPFSSVCRVALIATRHASPPALMVASWPTIAVLATPPRGWIFISGYVVFLCATREFPERLSIRSEPIPYKRGRCRLQGTMTQRATVLRRTGEASDRRCDEGNKRSLARISCPAQQELEGATPSIPVVLLNTPLGRRICLHPPPLSIAYAPLPSPNREHPAIRHGARKGQPHS